MAKRRWSLVWLLVVAGVLSLFQLNRLSKLHEQLPDSFQWDYPTILEDDDDHNVSACLLVMDDNHLLIEWLAYHYQTLPLRRLILASDPRSRTSPSRIVERWKTLNLMDITEWNDDDYFPRSYRRSILRHKVYTNATNRLVLLHRFRQKFFYVQCMRQLQNENRTWVALLDTDEFLLPNRNWKFQSLLPSKHNTRTPRNISTATSTTISKILHRLRNYKSLASPCVSLPRLLIGAKEDDEPPMPHNRTSSTQRLAPVLDMININASNLMTHRWKWHGPVNRPLLNKAGKSLMDVSRIPRTMIHLDEVNVHRPIMNICSVDGMWIPNDESPLILYHYVGSYEQWMYRSDPRGIRTRDLFETYRALNTSRVVERSQQDEEEEEDYTSRWVYDFFQTVGTERAKGLLEGVGKIEAVLHPIDELASYEALVASLVPNKNHSSTATTATVTANATPTRLS
jgi:hypothetical protein